MRDKAQTKTRLDEIPAELVTRKEAAEILGLRHPTSLATIERFKSLPFAYVRYKGNRIVLYNRKAIESLRYEPQPDGYITTKEACKLLGFEPSSATTVSNILKAHGLKRKLVKRHHPYYVWKLEEVENVKQLREKCAHVKKS